MELFSPDVNQALGVAFPFLFFTFSVDEVAQFGSVPPSETEGGGEGL